MARLFLAILFMFVGSAVASVADEQRDAAWINFENKRITFAGRSGEVCWDVPDALAGEGLQTQNCYAYSKTQLFNLTESGALVHLASGKCVYPAQFDKTSFRNYTTPSDTFYAFQYFISLQSCGQRESVSWKAFPISQETTIFAVTNVFLGCHVDAHPDPKPGLGIVCTAGGGSNYVFPFTNTAMHFELL